MQRAIQINVRLLRHQYQINQIVPLVVHGDVQHAHLGIVAQYIRVNLGIQQQIRRDLRSAMLDCQMQKRFAVEIVCLLLFLTFIIQIHFENFYEFEELAVLDKPVEHQIDLRHVALRHQCVLRYRRLV